MLLKLQPYDLDLLFKPGKEIPVGDVLSRAYLSHSEIDMEPITVNMIEHIAVSPTRYHQFQTETAKELNELYLMIMKGWSDTKYEVPHSIKQYWNIRDELSVYDSIVY